MFTSQCVPESNGFILETLPKFILRVCSSTVTKIVLPFSCGSKLHQNLFPFLFYNCYNIISPFMFFNCYQNYFSVWFPNWLPKLFFSFLFPNSLLKLLLLLFLNWLPKLLLFVLKFVTTIVCRFCSLNGYRNYFFLFSKSLPKLLVLFLS